MKTEARSALTPEGLVSVVVPAFNREGTIEIALKSALSQTLRPLEIIVADDGSTDRTPEIVLEMAEQHPTIQLVKMPVRGGGAPAARNKGAEVARGTFLAFLDADDYWEESKLEKQQLLLLQDNVCAAGTWYDQRQDIGDSGAALQQAEEIRFEDLLVHNLFGPTSILMVKKSDFERVGKFDPRMKSCQDWELCLRLSRIGRILIVQEVLTHQLVQGTDRITRNRNSVISGRKRMFGRIRQAVRKKDRRLLQFIKRRQYAVLVGLYLSFGEYSRAIRISSRYPSLRVAYRWVKAFSFN